MTQGLARWALFLSEFNFKIVFRAGSANGKPDAFSRRPDFASNIDDSNSSDVPFSILRSENFCAITSLISSLNDQILHECKGNKIYQDICLQLSSNENKSSKFKNFFKQ